MSKLVRHIEVCRDQLEALYPQGIPEELTQTLDKLTRAAQRQHRQTEALVKLSDATEAKLTQTNDALESLTQNLSRYVPQTVVDLLLNDHSEDDFSRSSRRDITAFFSDVVGFTSMAERLEPEQLSELLSDYFTEMSRIVERWGGTLISSLATRSWSFLAPHRLKASTMTRWPRCPWPLICKSSCPSCA